ncbi:MAG: phenylalanine--tRNA ligase subunit alpha [Planctomycetota bacterium]
MDIRARLADLEKEAAGVIAAAASAADLDRLTVQYTGRKGVFNDIMAGMGALGADERPTVGQAANRVKKVILDLLAARRAELETAAPSSAAEAVDVTARLKHIGRGSIHPLAQVQADLERIFAGLGFTIADGPHIESDFYNFEALNIPADHPAREHQDTFWLKDGLLLRTQTSSVQVRTYLTARPPIAVIVPGRVFRYEAVDASHENTFHQIEGFIVDTAIAIPHLIAILRTALTQVFGREVTVRLRPGYFPFVEPGYELDFRCLICNGTGCPVCKRSGWVEFLGCGMIHPNVLRAGNIDPARYTGFAFGMGLDRLTMMRHGINDIRVFQGCDLRALRQFASPSLV